MNTLLEQLDLVEADIKHYAPKKNQSVLEIFKNCQEKSDNVYKLNNTERVGQKYTKHKTVTDALNLYLKAIDKKRKLLLEIELESCGWVRQWVTDTITVADLRISRNLNTGAYPITANNSFRSNDIIVVDSIADFADDLSAKGWPHHIRELSNYQHTIHLVHYLLLENGYQFIGDRSSHKHKVYRIYKGYKLAS